MATSEKKPIVLDENLQSQIDTFRETIESIAMAIILAFMFRTFVVEAFVIPTGSMATTLQGRHMEVDCTQCGFRYRAGASSENSDVEHRREVLATTCPMCGYRKQLDKQGDPNQRSFTGDRILVSKFSYLFSGPKRWHVVVFRFPGNPKQPYIKRLIGLPGETIRISGGDIYHARDGQPLQIARKPDNRLLSMMQLVHDSDYRPELLDQIGWPRRWQPWSADPEAGQDWIAQGEGSGFLTKGATGRDTFVRYNHLVLRPEFWDRIASNSQQIEQLTALRADQQDVVADDLARQIFEREIPASGELVSDYYAYNDRLVDGGFGSRGGVHWVGDLAGEYQVDVQGETGSLLLDLVEGGVHYECQIDVASGKALLTINGGEASFGEATGPQMVQVAGDTGINSPGSYQLRFSNFDNELRLWVDGSRIEFDGPTGYVAAEKRVPRWTETDPLDGAPVGIGSRQLAMTVSRLKVYRDIYYIAVGPHDNNEYEPIRNTGTALSNLARYREWDSEPMFRERRTLEFTLGPREFFPLGDNSPQSKDARLWITDRFDEFSSEVAIKLGVVLTEENGPPRIKQVLPFGGADSSGLQVGDMLTGVDGLPVSSREDLIDLMRIKYEGSEIDLELKRGAETIRMTVPLGLRPSFHEDLLVGEALLVYWPHPWRVNVPGLGAWPLLPHFKRIGLIR